MLENNNDSLENKKWTCPFNNAVNFNKRFNTYNLSNFQQFAKEKKNLLVCFWNPQLPLSSAMVTFTWKHQRNEFFKSIQKKY